MHIHTLSLIAAGLLLCTTWAPAAAAPPSTVGFLVVAQDRGFLGNQEIRALVDEFKQSYPAALGLVGRDAASVDGAYAGYLSRAAQELKQAGATEIVAIPLFLSDADPLLTHIKPLVPAHTGGLPVRWAPAMAHDYLIGQIVLDRVEALSEQAGSERLILVGSGAMDEASAMALKADLQKLLAYVARYKKFRDAEIVMYYDRAAERAGQNNKDITAYLLAQIAKQGRTLLVPVSIGPKFDTAMSLTSWLGGQFKHAQAVYKPNELLPHPNALLWLKKTANRDTPLSAASLGLVIMPHGSTQPWNDAVESAIQPLRSHYPIEMAYGMGDPYIIQEAVSRLEQRGIRRIVFVRMYALDHHMKSLTDYILGLAEHAAEPGHESGHGHASEAPPQVRTAALFSTFGGYEQNPEIAHVLHTRIAEISTDPANETVLLIAHGEGTDEGNDRWLAVMNQNIARLRQDPHCAALKSVQALTVREDWPKEREQAVAAARAIVEAAGKNGRVLVIANRLYGSGPYKTMLKGLTYDMNEKGLVHPILTRWLEDGVRRLTAELIPHDAEQQYLARP
jgi:sirohydrochlorin ferrochelatase